MNEDRAAGAANKAAGTIQEEFGRIARDTQAQIRGQARQAKGAAEDLYGQAQETASGIADVVRDFVDRQPYTALAIAAGLGWLLGRMRRPL